MKALKIDDYVVRIDPVGCDFVTDRGEVKMLLEVRDGVTDMVLASVLPNRHLTETRVYRSDYRLATVAERGET